MCTWPSRAAGRCCWLGHHRPASRTRPTPARPSPATSCSTRRRRVRSPDSLLRQVYTTAAIYPVNGRDYRPRSAAVHQPSPGTRRSLQSFWDPLFFVRGSIATLLGGVDFLTRSVVPRHGPAVRFGKRDGNELQPLPGSREASCEAGPLPRDREACLGSVYRAVTSIDRGQIRVPCTPSFHGVATDRRPVCEPRFGIGKRGAEFRRVKIDCVENVRFIFTRHALFIVDSLAFLSTFAPSRLDCVANGEISKGYFGRRANSVAVPGVFQVECTLWIFRS